MSLLLFHSGNSHKFSNLATRPALVILGFMMLSPLGAASAEGESPQPTGEQGLITVELTTPTQERFTIGALAGTYVTIHNNSSGEEFALLFETSANSLGKPDATPDSQRHRPRRFNIRFFERFETPEGSSWHQFALAEGVRAEQEFVEPISGFGLRPKLFEPLKTEDLKHYVDGAGIRIMCCVDCGGFSVCGARVSGCGMICNNCESCARACPKAADFN